MRTASRDAVGGLLRVVVAVATVAALAGACTNTPDTALHPHPPAVTYARLEHPFRGARLFVDDQTAGARWQREHAARWLDPITTRPQARWLNGPHDLARLPGLAVRARRQQALLVLVAYYIPNRGCSASGQGAPSSARYGRWIGRLIHQLGSTRAAIVVEPDAVAADCFDSRRARLLKRSVKRLADAGQYVYLDAGHARWRSTGEMAERLLRAGIQYAQGFSVNVANRQTTKQSYRWGRELSDLLGQREFVIDTSRNGLGPPPDDPDRDDEWCNPRHQALGQAPTTTTSMPGLAALLWIKLPGESDGICGGETTYLFSPRQARQLAVNSPFVPIEDRRLAEAAGGAARPGPPAVRPTALGTSLRRPAGLAALTLGSPPSQTLVVEVIEKRRQQLSGRQELLGNRQSGVQTPRQLHRCRVALVRGDPTEHDVHITCLHARRPPPATPPR